MSNVMEEAAMTIVDLAIRQQRAHEDVRSTWEAHMAAQNRAGEADIALSRAVVAEIARRQDRS